MKCLPHSQPLPFRLSTEAAVQAPKVQTVVNAAVPVPRHPKTMTTGAVAEHESYLLCPGRQPVQIPPNHNVSNRIRLQNHRQGDRRAMVGREKERMFSDAKDRTLTASRQNNNTAIQRVSQRQGEHGKRYYYHHKNYHHRPPTAKHLVIDIYHWICH